MIFVHVPPFECLQQIKNAIKAKKQKSTQPFLDGFIK